jgi:hypothetical protein
VKLKPYEEGKPRCDLSIAGWNYQALKAGFAAGSTAEGLEGAIEKSIEGIKKTHRTSEGGFTYSIGQEGKGTETLTSVGVLCLQLFGEKNASETKTGLKVLEAWSTGDVAPLEMNWKKSGNTGFALYRWYYKTQAIFQGHNGKGGAWRKWNISMKKELLKRQERDGHWSTPAQLYENEKMRKLGGHGEHYTIPGATNKAPFTTKIDLYVYSTALCTLMLEVYYRYLPSFKVVHGKGAASESNSSEKDDDDLNLDL